MPAPFYDRSRTAFTLPEMLVASALLLVLTSLVMQFFFPALRYQSRGLVQSELMRQGYRAMDCLTRDLRLCPAALVSYDPSAHRLVGRAQSGWTPDGTAVYSTRCWVYEWDGGQQRLRRGSLVIGGAPLDMLALPGRVGLHELTAALPQASWQALCLGAVEFDFRHQGVDPTAPSGSYQVHLSLRQGEQHLELGQNVTPRLKL